MQDIETGLHSLHSQARETSMDTDTRAGADDANAGAEPFARVLVVVNGSPADNAGIRVSINQSQSGVCNIDQSQQGDLLAKFGSVTKDNFKQLKNISDVAESSRNRY